MKYIIYKITNKISNKIYIGAHMTSNIHDMYMGSSKHLRKDIKKIGKDNFTKEILFVYDNKDDMVKKERELVNKEFCYREDTYNIMIGGISGSFNYSGMTTVKNKDNEFIKVYIDDPRYLSGEYVSIHKETLTVKDKDGNTFRVAKNDPRYLSGELVFEKTGMVNVKDKDGNRFSVSKDDPRYLSGELKHTSSGLILVKDKDGNRFSVSKDDPRYLSGELVYIFTGMVNVKDKDGNRFSVSKDDPRYLSGELVSWCKGRIGIKGMLGKKRTEKEKEYLRSLAMKRTGLKSSTFGKTCINNGQINKMVYKKDLELYIMDGWSIGRKK